MNVRLTGWRTLNPATMYVCIKNIQLAQHSVDSAAREGLHGLSTDCSTANVGSCGLAMEAAREECHVGINGANVLFYRWIYPQHSVLAKK